MTYEQWYDSDRRDPAPLQIHDAPQRVLYDRFICVFVLLDMQKIIPIEALFEVARR